MGEKEGYREEGKMKTLKKGKEEDNVDDDELVDEEEKCATKGRGEEGRDGWQG